jgi:DNA helicase-2/ATP-dependent DNA helicase PcrA
VLYRSNAQSRVIEHALFSSSIPYRVYGGLRFFERAEVKHALAYLRLVALPDDDSAFLRVANFPPRGIGTRTIEQVQDAAKQRNEPARGRGSADGARRTGACAFPRADRAAASRVRRVAARRMRRARRRGKRLIEHYKAERDGAERVENLGELVNAAASFTEEDREVESGAEVDELSAFLAHAALEAGEHQAGEGQDALQ